MYLKCNEDASSFTWEELRHVAGAIGFPKDLFERNLPREYTVKKDGICMKDLLRCIEERYFNVDLHYTVNLKSGAHNATCLKKAILFVSKRYLSFKELLEVRLAFETYEEYDQKGMRINENTFLRTLKMCGRVISPKKLMHKVKHIRSSYIEQGRIQFFEFLDLLILCELSENYHVTYDLNSPVEKTWTKLYKIDDFKHFTIPKDKKLWRHLNQEYKDKELSYNHPKMESKNFARNPLKSEDFRYQVKLSNQQFESLHRSLKNSNEQVQLAKGGFTYARPQHTMSRASGGKTSSPTMSKASARPSTPICSGTSPSCTVKEKRQQRPQSSPPVLSNRMLKDSKAKVDNLKFDICTESQRWSEHYLANISSCLPNYPDVLKRMRKPPQAPRRKRFYRRERPSPAIISRLSSHETKPPVEHVERCDALTRGTGTDQHSLALKKQAKKIRCNSAPVVSKRMKSASSRKSGRQSKHSSLLESLMHEYGYMSGDESSESDPSAAQEDNAACTIAEEEKDHRTLIESQLVATEETILEDKENEVSEVETEDLESACEPTVQSPSTHSDVKQKIMEEYFMWRQGRYSRMKKLIEETGYYRTYIDPNQKDERTFLKMGNKTAQHDNVDKQEKIVKEACTGELSDFEKYLLNPDNLRIPDNNCIYVDAEDFYERRKKMKALRRIAHRYPVEERKWFMSSAKANKVV